MTARLFGAAALLLAALPAAADCGPPPADDASLIARADAAHAIATAHATMPHADGRLWRVETDPPSHIVGTFHVAADGIAEPGPILKALVESATGLYLELETHRVRDDFARWSANPGNIFRDVGTRLTDKMDDAERDHAAAVLAHYGMPLAVADTLKPLMRGTSGATTNSWRIVSTALNLVTLNWFVSSTFCWHNTVAGMTPLPGSAVHRAL